MNSNMVGSVHLKEMVSLEVLQAEHNPITEMWLPASSESSLKSVSLDVIQAFMSGEATVQHSSVWEKVREYEVSMDQRRLYMADVLAVDGDVVDWVLKVGGYDIDYMPAYLLQKLSERVERDNNYPKFYRSLMTDYPEECESILDQGYALPFKYEYTPLMMAVCRNHTSLALKLLDTLP